MSETNKVGAKKHGGVGGAGRRPRAKVQGHEFPVAEVVVFLPSRLRLYKVLRSGQGPLQSAFGHELVRRLAARHASALHLCWKPRSFS